MVGLGRAEQSVIDAPASYSAAAAADAYTLHGRSTSYKDETERYTAAVSADVHVCTLSAADVQPKWEDFAYIPRPLALRAGSILLCTVSLGLGATSKQASIFICPINKQRYNIDE